MNIILNIPPPKGTAQQQKTGVRHGKIIKYDPPNVKAMKQTYTMLLNQHKPKEQLTGPLCLSILFAYPYKKIHIENGETRDIWKDTQPDWDNMVKGLVDIMEKLGFFKNDGQVSLGVVEKVWSANPRVEIDLERLGKYR
jgi:Holliday junction resolvase RusA-like endonuclease